MPAQHESVQSATNVERDCSNCGKVEVSVPVIVDLGVTTPENLADDIENGVVHNVHCPGCRRDLGVVDAPLLVYFRSGQREALFPRDKWSAMFLPAPGMTADRNREHFDTLVTHLCRQVEWPGPQAVLHGVPWSLVPILLRQGEDAAWLQLCEILQQFVETRTLHDSLKALREHPELLNGLVLGILESMREHMRSQGHEGNAGAYEERRQLLIRCREIGIDQAFAEKAGCSVEELPTLQLDAAIKQAMEAWTQYEETHSGLDLDRAIELWMQIMVLIQTTPIPADRRADVMCVASELLQRRYLSHGRVSDLQYALTWLRTAAVEIPPESILRPQLLHLLGTALHMEHNRTGQLDALEHAINAFRDAAEAAAERAHDGSDSLYGLAGAKLTRYSRQGDLEDLDEAIHSFRQVMLTTTKESSAHLSASDGLCSALRLRFERTRGQDDLEHAIQVGREALAKTPRSDEAWPTLLNNIGSALSVRYSWTGGLDDLHESIAMFRKAVYVTPEESPQWLERIFNLGVVMCKRYDRLGRRSDVHLAIDCYRRALTCLTEDAPMRSTVLRALGTALNELVQRAGQGEHLQETIEVCRQAVHETPESSPEWYRSINDLGRCLNTRYEQTGCIADHDQSIECYRLAAHSAPANGCGRPGCLDNLGSSLLVRYRRTRQKRDLDEARQAFAEVIESGLDGNLYVLLTTCRKWGQWCLEQRNWQEAARVFKLGLEAARQLYRGQVLRADQESWLGEQFGMHAWLAYCQIRMGAFRDAVSALEDGRARLLVEHLEGDRIDLESLPHQAREVYTRYEEARKKLGELRTLEHNLPGKPRASDDLLRQIRAAEDEVGSLLGSIRALIGVEDFHASSEFEELEHRLEPNVPVLYLTATPIGGFVLSVYKDESGTRLDHRWLDSLTETTVRELFDGPADQANMGGWFNAFAQWKETPEEPTTMRSWNLAIERTGRRLWDLVMGPALDLLATLAPLDGADVPVQEAVLIPDGLLALLPLHAAWTDQPARRWAIDDIAWRYAPSLRVLAHAQEIAQHCTLDNLLAIDEPGPLPEAPLPNSGYEVAAAVRTFPHSEVLRHEQCHREEILDAITRADVCHFSCHGYTDVREPIYSSLLLAEKEVLTVAHLFGLPALRARMAVLSACATGLIGSRVPDEVVSLPTAFLQAGFASVVAPFWTVYDISTALLMSRFYEVLGTREASPACALQRAQIWLRELSNRELIICLELLVPDLVPKAPAASTAMFHFRALLQDPDARPFASPVHWAAFTLTGA